MSKDFILIYPVPYSLIGYLIILIKVIVYNYPNHPDQYIIIVIGRYTTNYPDYSYYVIFYYVTLTPRGSLIISLVTYDPLTPSMVVIYSYSQPLFRPTRRVLSYRGRVNYFYELLNRTKRSIKKRYLYYYSYRGRK